jgi:hypothetical protein
MLKALLVKKGLQLAITVASTTVIPWLVYDRPRIAWVWDQVGPRIVETANDYVEDGDLDVSPFVLPK